MNMINDMTKKTDGILSHINIVNFISFARCLKFTTDYKRNIKAL